MVSSAVPIALTFLLFAQSILLYSALLQSNQLHFRCHLRAGGSSLGIIITNDQHQSVVLTQEEEEVAAARSVLPNNCTLPPRNPIANLFPES